jgi:hypothetical protein
MRNGANSAWINVAYFDQAGGAFRILDDTQITNTSGVQTGLLGGQATADWEAGTATLESLVSPAAVAAAIAAQGSSTVLLGTIATTGGTSQTLSGLTLTSYKTLRAVFNGVLKAGTIVGSQPDLFFVGCFTGIDPSTSDGARGIVDIDLATGAGISNLSVIGATAPVSEVATSRVLRSSTTTASSSVSVTLVGGTTQTFGGGSVLVYGVR